MAVIFRFRCHACGEIHEGVPALHADAPLSYHEVPEAERATRCDLGSDRCVIDSELFFVLGRIEVPIHGHSEPFVWALWVSLSETSFTEWASAYDLDRRSHLGPYFGWLNARVAGYPDTLNLKTSVHLRDGGLRPHIELEPTDHPFAVEQRRGIDVDRVAELYALSVHGEDFDGSAAAVSPTSKPWWRFRRR